MMHDLHLLPKQCPTCGEALSPLQVWHQQGGQFARCSPCAKLYIVTSLPEYGVRQEVIIGETFVNVSPLNESELGLSVAKLNEFDDTLRRRDFDKARALIKEPRSDAARMFLEYRFYEGPDPGLAQGIYEIAPVKGLRPHIKDTIEFLLGTDTSIYTFPTNEEIPPEISYRIGRRLPPRTTLLNPSNVSALLRRRHEWLLDQILADMERDDDARLVLNSPPLLDEPDRKNQLWGLLYPRWWAEKESADESYARHLRYAREGKEHLAAAWNLKAAAQGSVEAMYVLGLRYAAGKGMPRDEEEAQRRFRQAADDWRDSPARAKAKKILAMRYAPDGVLNNETEAWESYLKEAWEHAIPQYTSDLRLVSE